MSQTTPNPKPTSRLKKILQGLSEDQKQKPARRPADVSALQPAETGYTIRNRFLPAFWTVASIISMFVNVVLIAILLIALRMLGTIQLTADDQFSGMLGGLYHNFVRMDNASIIKDVPVNANIPLNLMVPVQTTTRIRLSEDVIIPAHVVINTGGVDIDADATVTLYADSNLRSNPPPQIPNGPTTLPVTLDFPLTVQNTIPVSLNVPVNIPLSQTQLHEPFVGLQEVVRPYYCLVEPNATLNGVQICSPLANPITP
jgi:hypothetical protein